MTWASTAWSGNPSFTRTMGHPAESVQHFVLRVERIADEKRFAPVNAENGPARVFGLRKKKPPVTRSRA